MANRPGTFKPGNKAAVGHGPPVNPPKQVNVIYQTTFNAAVSHERKRAFVAEQFRQAEAGEAPEMTRLFLERCVPIVKPVSLHTPLHVDDPSDPAQVCVGILRAVSDGTMDAATAGDLLKAIESLVNISQTLSLGPQLADMQAQLEKLTGNR